MDIKDFYEQHGFYPAGLMNHDEEIPMITKEEVIREIRFAEETSGMTLDEYKRAIEQGEVKNYSRAQLRMWERLVRALEVLESDE